MFGSRNRDTAENEIGMSMVKWNSALPVRLSYGNRSAPPPLGPRLAIPNVFHDHPHRMEAMTMLCTDAPRPKFVAIRLLKERHVGDDEPWRLTADCFVVRPCPSLPDLNPGLSLESHNGL